MLRPGTGCRATTQALWARSRWILRKMRGIIAEGFKDVYFQDGGNRALGISDVAINDIDYLDLDY